jgi:hypothetical protein
LSLIFSPEDAIEITLDVNTRIQILDELNHLAGARKHQFAAFCRQEQCLVVWADEVETLIPSAEALEQRMIAYVWSGRHHELAALEAETKDIDEDEGEGWVDRDAEKERQLEAEEDEEGNIGAEPDEWERRDKRPMMLYAPLISGFAIILCFVFIGSGLRTHLPATIQASVNKQVNWSRKSCSMVTLLVSLSSPLLLSAIFSL